MVGAVQKSSLDANHRICGQRALHAAFLNALFHCREVPFRGPTALGRSIGLSVEERSGKRGPYQVTLYHPDAQHFILDNLDDILSPVSATAE